MIVIHRMEVTDAERSALSLRLHPKALKRLATGTEIKQYQSEGWSKITAPEQSEELDKVEIADLESGEHDYFAPTPSNAQDQERPQGKGLKSALASINNAMFSLANARRQLDNETWLYVLKDAKALVYQCEALRATIVELHDEELEDE